MPPAPEQHPEDQPGDEREHCLVDEVLSEHVLDKHHTTYEAETEEKKANGE